MPEKPSNPSAAPASALPNPRPRVVICPFCGCTTEEASACSQCNARFDPLSRQATQNTMGPWWIRDQNKPFTPGCRFQTLVKLIEAGKISPNTVLRGPSTRQFWMLAKHTPGVANLLGQCHNCAQPTDANAFACDGCGALFTVDSDRQHLGLGPARELGSPPSITQAAAPPANQSGRSPRAMPHTSAVVKPSRPVASPMPSKRIRTISGRRIAVNWVVGTAVFTIVVGLVLTALEVVPVDLFRRTLADPLREPLASPIVAAIEDEAKSQASSGFLGSADQSLESGSSQEFSNDQDPPRLGVAEFVPPSKEKQQAESPASPEPGVSRIERIRLDAIEALRLGDPKAVRESLTQAEALLTLPRAPQWAAPIRARLLNRLERGQFARLP